MGSKGRIQTDFFSNRDDTSGLRERSLNSGIWIMIGQLGGHSLRLISIVILARLLTPEDYGLIAMVAVLTNFIQMFKDIGLNVAIIQSPQITRQEVSNLFWYNSLISLLLGLIVASCAPLITWFYQRSELLYITITLAFSFPISGLIIQHIALLQRQLQYRQVAFIQILSCCVSIVCAVTAAVLGCGYWSLVIMELSGVISTTAFAFYFCPWLPQRYSRHTRTAHYLKFGGYLTGSNFCDYFASNLDKLLIGKTLNPAILGQYTKACDLSLLPLRKISYPLNNLGVATLSKLRDEPDRYRNYYTFAQEALLLVLGPLFALGFSCSHNVFALFLGSQWLAAAPIFSWFCLLSFATTCTSPNRWLFLSQGRSRDFLILTLIGAAVSMLAFFGGIRFGIMGITICYTLSTLLIRTPLSLFMSSRSGPVSLRDQLGVILPTLLLSAVMAGIIKLLLTRLQPQSDIVAIALALAVYLLCFATAFIISSSWRRRLSRLLRILLEKLKLPVPAIILRNSSPASRNQQHK